MSLDSLQEGQGIGTNLVEEIIQEAREAGCQRLFLPTTNDNLRALGFYQKRGFELVSIRRGAVNEARKIKPDDKAHGNTGYYHNDGSDITKPDIFFIGCVGVDITFINIIYDVRRCSIDSGCKVAHESGQQACHQETQQTHRNIGCQHPWQYAFEIGFGKRSGIEFVKIHQRKNGKARDHKIACRVQDHIHQRAHF